MNVKERQKTYTTKDVHLQSVICVDRLYLRCRTVGDQSACQIHEFSPSIGTEAERRMGMS